MRKLDALFAISAVLGGCVVTPRHHVFVAPVVVAAPVVVVPSPVVVAAPVVVVPSPVPMPQTTMGFETNTVYPEYESAYVWDPAFGAFFWFGGHGERHYMPHGWNYRSHRVPHYHH
jgi:hypothetical protein